MTLAGQPLACSLCPKTRGEGRASVNVNAQDAEKEHENAASEPSTTASGKH